MSSTSRPLLVLLWRLASPSTDRLRRARSSLSSSLFTLPPSISLSVSQPLVSSPSLRPPSPNFLMPIREPHTRPSSLWTPSGLTRHPVPHLACMQGPATNYLLCGTPHAAKTSSRLNVLYAICLKYVAMPRASPGVQQRDGSTQHPAAAACVQAVNHHPVKRASCQPPSSRLTGCTGELQ